MHTLSDMFNFTLESKAAFTKIRLTRCRIQVVLATNIAETSVTIDDVVYVVDCGKIKEKHFDASRNMTTVRVQVCFWST